MMEHIQEYMQRMQELNEEYDLELRAEPGQFLMIVRNSDPSRELIYLNDEGPVIDPNRADVFWDEINAVAEELVAIDEE